MNLRNIGYWIITVLVAVAFVMGGVMYLAHAEEVVKGIAALGYPPYFLLILGTWKLLGGIAILLPRTPLLKEWAYAGMLFNLTGAAASHIAVHDPVGEVITPLVILALAAASYFLRPASRRVGGNPGISTSG